MGPGMGVGARLRVAWVREGVGVGLRSAREVFGWIRARVAGSGDGGAGGEGWSMGACAVAALPASGSWESVSGSVPELRDRALLTAL